MSDTAATTVTIRDATIEDVDFIAWDQLTASRSHVPVGIWEYINGSNEEETVAFLADLARTDAVHWCHYSLFQVAEVGGVPVAGLCGFDHTTQGMDAMNEVVPGVAMAAGMTMDDFPGVMERGGIVQRVVSDYEPGAWVIENVATRPEFRRRGIIDGLLRSILDRGREKGFELAQISVFIGNEPARAAYIKAGFEKVDEKRDAEFEVAMGFPGFERLLRKL
jgi:ribosomal protein S18 acetylase RimI-like enzyme